MATRKRITPLQRARQRVSRVNALQTAVPYERKIRTKRTKGITAALDDLVKRDVPPGLWANEVDYTEPWMTPLLTDMYLTIGHTGAVEVANRMLARKADTTDVFSRAILAWAREHLGQRITLMGGTISAWLRETIAAIYEANSTEGVEKLTKRLYAETQSAWDSIKKWQCRRIAQTEAMKSMNIAGHAAAEALGIAYEKTWSISGVNTRESHAAIDGITLPQGELFMVGGYPMEEPMDETYGAPAGEVINCACTLIYLPADNGLTEL